MSLVWKIRLEPNRAGRLQDLIIDEHELAFIEINRAVLAVGEHRKRRFGLLLLLLDLRQVRLRERENQRDRLDLRDDHEPTRVGGMDDVANIDLTQADNAVDRGRQSRVAEL